MTITPTQTREAALAFLSAGATYAEGAARFGVSERTLRNWWDDAGMPPRRPGRRKSKPADDIALAGRWVRDGLIWRHEGAA